jgi:cobalt/nickel transport system permease protein
MVRYIEVVHREYHRLRNAMRLRGFRARCNRHTFRSLGYLIGMLVVRSLDRAHRIVEAMRCRGFRGRFYLLARFRVGAADILFAAIIAAGIALLGWMEWA